MNLSLEEVTNLAFLSARQELVGIKFHADWILCKPRPSHESIRLLAQLETLNLKLHLISVGVRVIHRHRDSVVNAPIGLNSQFLELLIVVEKLI